MKRLLTLLSLLFMLSAGAQVTPAGKTRGDDSFTQVDSYATIFKRLGIPTSESDNLTAGGTAANTVKLIYNSTLKKLRIYDPVTASWKDAVESQDLQKVTSLGNVTRETINVRENTFPALQAQLTGGGGGVAALRASHTDLNGVIDGAVASISIGSNHAALALSPVAEGEARIIIPSNKNLNILNGSQVKNVVYADGRLSGETPLNANDFATKNYVDGKAEIIVEVSANADYSITRADVVLVLPGNTESKGKNLLFPNPMDFKGKKITIHYSTGYPVDDEVWFNSGPYIPKDELAQQFSNGIRDFNQSRMFVFQSIGSDWICVNGKYAYPDY